MQWPRSPACVAARPRLGLRFSGHRPGRFSGEQEPMGEARCQWTHHRCSPAISEPPAVCGPWPARKESRRGGRWVFLAEARPAGGQWGPRCDLPRSPGDRAGALGSGGSGSAAAVLGPHWSLPPPPRLPGVCPSPGWGMQARDGRAVAERPPEGQGSQRPAGLTAQDSLELVVNTEPSGDCVWESESPSPAPPGWFPPPPSACLAGRRVGWAELGGCCPLGPGGVSSLPDPPVSRWGRPLQPVACAGFTRARLHGVL